MGANADLLKDAASQMGVKVELLFAGKRSQALEEVRTELTLEAIVKAENLTVTDEEYTEEVEKMAKTYKMPDADLKKMLADKRHAEAVKETVLRRKAAQIIVDSAVKS